MAGWVLGHWGGTLKASAGILETSVEKVVYSVPSSNESERRSLKMGMLASVVDTPRRSEIPAVWASQTLAVN